MMPGKRRAGIAGLGFYVPEQIVTNRDLEKSLNTSDEWIRTRTGIVERRIAGPEQAASDLGVIAAQRALEDAGLAAEELDLIIVATASPDMVFPSTACLIQKRIHALQAGAFDLSAVCSGFLFAYITAVKMVTTGRAKKVLIVATEKFSSFLDWQDRSTCVLMGDGAGAVVITEHAPQAELLAASLGLDSSGIEDLWVPAGGSARPATHETVNQRLHYMKMNGRNIFKFAVRIIGESISTVLKQADLQTSDLDFLVLHQANIRIIHAAAKRFNLPMEKILVNIDRYSNTSAASVPILLAEAKQQGKFKPGMRIALAAFGAGLTWGSAIIQW